MIYTRWENQVIIHKNHDQHPNPSNPKAIITLVEVKYLETQDYGYQFAEILRADRGWEEISEAIEKAAYLKMSGKPLEEALNQAQ